MLTKSDRAHDLAIAYLRNHPLDQRSDETPEEHLQDYAADYSRIFAYLLTALDDPKQ